MNVTISTGQLVGTTDSDGVTMFYGIPFAEPPVGERQFAAPEPRSVWPEVRDARRPGPTPQRRPFSEFSTVPEPSIAGDDTLLVNVATTAPGDLGARLPVLVWIHGGGYFAGSPSSPWYRGDAFARDGIVVVSISYRLGVVGFGDVPGAPANRGVRDWIAALEWVQREIHVFGGDPERVTIAGQSAGGGAVMTLLGMESQQHLFAQAIAQSPAIGLIEPGMASERGRRVRQRGGFDAARLRRGEVAEEAILDAQKAAMDDEADLASQVEAAFRDDLALGTAFGPVRDGELLAEQTIESLRRGVGGAKPLLIGTTHDEFVMTAWGAQDLLGSADAIDFLVAHGLAPDSARGYAAANELTAAHEALGRMTTDTTFRRPVLEVADISRPGGTWLYDFRWSSPALGIAMHCLDLPFMWGVADEESARVLVGDVSPADLMRTMHDAWVAFIRTGDAGWPRYRFAQPLGMVFDVESRVVPDPYAQARIQGRGPDAVHSPVPDSEGAEVLG